MSPGGTETDHLRLETASMQGGGTEALAAKSTRQAPGQQVSSSPSLDTNSLWVLTEEDVTECPGVRPPAELLSG